MSNPAFFGQPTTEDRRPDRLPGHTRYQHSVWYICIVEPIRKITVEIPGALLEKAQQASGSGITQTVRAGLQLVAASQTYARLRQMRGKVRFTRTGPAEG